MSEQTYAQKIVALSDAIAATAKEIDEAERARANWSKPGGSTIYVGVHCYLVRQDGTVTPGLDGVYRELIAAIDARLYTLHGRLEGLRFRLARLGREGGVA